MAEGNADLFDQILKTIKIKGTATVLHKPGAVRLDAYPHLCFAPIEHGPGIRTENNGTPVEAIVTELSVNPDMDAVAAKFGVTPAHVRDAVNYAAATGFIET